MKRTLSLVSVALATQFFSGCVAVPLAFMAANIAASSLITDSVQKSHADQCYDIEVKAKADGLNPAQTRRELAAKNCSTAGQ